MAQLLDLASCFCYSSVYWFTSNVLVNGVVRYATPVVWTANSRNIHVITTTHR